MLNPNRRLRTVTFKTIEDFLLCMEKMLKDAKESCLNSQNIDDYLRYLRVAPAITEQYITQKNRILLTLTLTGLITIEQLNKQENTTRPQHGNLEKKAEIYKILFGFIQEMSAQYFEKIPSQININTKDQENLELACNIAKTLSDSEENKENSKIASSIYNILFRLSTNNPENIPKKTFDFEENAIQTAPQTEVTSINEAEIIQTLEELTRNCFRNAFTPDNISSYLEASYSIYNFLATLPSLDPNPEKHRATLSEVILIGLFIVDHFNQKISNERDLDVAIKKTIEKQKNEIYKNFVNIFTFFLVTITKEERETINEQIVTIATGILEKLKVTLTKEPSIQFRKVIGNLQESAYRAIFPEDFHVKSKNYSAEKQGMIEFFLRVWTINATILKDEYFDFILYSITDILKKDEKNGSEKSNKKKKNEKNTEIEKENQKKTEEIKINATRKNIKEFLHFSPKYMAKNSNEAEKFSERCIMIFNLLTDTLPQPGSALPEEFFEYVMDYIFAFKPTYLHSEFLFNLHSLFPENLIEKKEVFTISILSTLSEFIRSGLFPEEDESLKAYKNFIEEHSFTENNNQKTKECPLKKKKKKNKKKKTDSLNSKNSQIESNNDDLDSDSNLKTTSTEENKNITQYQSIIDENIVCDKPENQNETTEESNSENSSFEKELPSLEPKEEQEKSFNKIRVTSGFTPKALQNKKTHDLLSVDLRKKLRQKKIFQKNNANEIPHDIFLYGSGIYTPTEELMATNSDIDLIIPNICKVDEVIEKIKDALKGDERFKVEEPYFFDKMLRKKSKIITKEKEIEEIINDSKILPLEYADIETGSTIHIDLTIYTGQIENLLDTGILAPGNCFHALGSQKTFSLSNTPLDLITLSTGVVELLPHVNTNIFVTNPSFIFRTAKVVAKRKLPLGIHCQSAINECQCQTTILFQSLSDAKFKKDIERLLKLPSTDYHTGIKFLEENNIFPAIRTKFSSCYNIYKNLSENVNLPSAFFTPSKCELLNFFVGQGNKNLTSSHIQNYDNFFISMGLPRLDFSPPLTTKNNSNYRNNNSNFYHQPHIKEGIANRKDLSPKFMS